MFAAAINKGLSVKIYQNVIHSTVANSLERVSQNFSKKTLQRKFTTSNIKNKNVNATIPPKKSVESSDSFAKRNPFIFQLGVATGIGIGIFLESNQLYQRCLRKIQS
mmetsp:Transcript_26005/g.29751  ORF Transcript_26005/g.29751 Transcript_26005/m.29751 type:complete len:107 (+) Transcript_26005:188-508(+)